jgi:hypothetical protein
MYYIVFNPLNFKNESGSQFLSKIYLQIVEIFICEKHSDLREKDVEF